MNQQSILQSNLLDIIFENRNKDYGAYKLRKSYQSRLGLAVFSAVGLALGLSLFFSFQNSPVVFKPLDRPVYLPDKKVSGFYNVPRPGTKKIVTRHTAMKHLPETERPPLIVTSNNINNLPATPEEIQSSFTGTGVPGMNMALGAEVPGEGRFDGNAATIKMESAGPGKPVVVEVAEIMPQYPGGVQALLSFLKKNIHSPGSIEEAADVTVRIEFVVNYDGHLENFIVVKSGGEAFDNEVLRVLKKMPPWIPGKSKGKNVSVYYIVPVKFTGEF